MEHAMAKSTASPHVLRLKPLRARVSEAEWQARVDLAAAFRLADLYGMSDMIYTHMSLRVPDAPNHFLLNPHGLLFDEVTASALLKVDLDGNVIEKPDGEYGLHQAAFVIHSALYRARPDVNGAMHTHTIAGMAVSALQCGLLPLTQTATRFCSRLAYHDFNGPERDPNERDALARDLGSMNYMILRNHGLLTVGRTIAEAFTAMYGLERSCQAQLAAMACNTALNQMPREVVEKSIDMYDPKVIRRYGLLEWPGLLRKLDRKDPSYRE
jgi:ribulose-5-phosphate 4-epimerase/fuculose-1-phosphate aldolase